MPTFLQLLPDLVILAVLVLFAWRGAKRGMILTLCSLLALIVAFVGASLLARYLAPPVSARLEPYLASVIEETIIEQTDKFRPAAPPEDAVSGEEPDAVQTPESDLDLDLGLLGSFLHSEWYERIIDAVRQGVSGAVSSVSQSLGATLADALAYTAIFLFGFVVMLLLWFIFSHALDLAFRLPVLSTFNTAGGLLLGLMKALVLLFILASVLRRYPGTLPESMVSETYLLRFFLTVSPWTLLSDILGG